MRLYHFLIKPSPSYKLWLLYKTEFNTSTTYCFRNHSVKDEECLDNVLSPWESTCSQICAFMMYVCASK